MRAGNGTRIRRRYLLRASLVMVVDIIHWITRSQRDGEGPFQIGRVLSFSKRIHLFLFHYLFQKFSERNEKEMKIVELYATISSLKI